MAALTCLQGELREAEQALAEARTQLALEQRECAARTAVTEQQAASLASEAARLDAARAAWAAGEAERRQAASLLEDARAEAARVKACSLLFALQASGACLLVAQEHQGQGGLPLTPVCSPREAGLVGAVRNRGHAGIQGLVGTHACR